jgi:DNA-binding XRE family transcriptional regulator
MIDRLSLTERQMLGDRLRLHREWMGLFEWQVAEKVGRSRFSVIDWEQGRAIPKPETRVALADLFGMAPEDLFAELYTALARGPRRRPRRRRARKAA